LGANSRNKLTPNFEQMFCSCRPGGKQLLETRN
jgi:hypothetical protein